MAWLILGLAWTFANPPFAAPDEADHYVRAYGVGQGHLVGSVAPGVTRGENAAERAWVAQTIRKVNMPAGLDPTPFSYVANPTVPAGYLNSARPSPTPSQVATGVGTYQPLPYVVPGLAEHLGHQPVAADRFGRAANLLVTLVLLAIALYAMADALIGVVAAVTPTVVFLAASVTDSSFEIAAGIAFVASLLRLSRDEHPSARMRLLTAVSGCALALSRAPGPLWIAIALVIVAALVGVRPLVRELGQWPIVALVVAVALNRVWEAEYGATVPYSLHLHSELSAGVHAYGSAAPTMIAGFGYLEWHLPVWVYGLWAALVAGVVGFALRYGRRRERLVLSGAVLGGIVLPPLFWIVVLSRTGFGLQGRHILPIMVAIPLLAAEILRRRGRAMPWIWVWTSVAGLVQFAAFFFNARRAAVGTQGPIDFFGHAAWRPPGGWATWLVLAAAGSVLLAVGPGALRARLSADPRLRKVSGEV